MSSDHNLLPCGATSLFDGPYEIWTFDKAWKKPALAVESGSHDRVPSLLPPGGMASNRPLIRTRGDGKCEVALPVSRHEDVWTVAVGTATAQPAQLIDVLWSISAELAEQRAQVREQQQSLDAYARQISLDFEELTWLRSLAQQVELCDVTQSLESVAEQVLPSLCDVIGAESLILVAQEGRSELSNADPATPARTFYRCSGRKILSESQCRDLIGELDFYGNGFPVVLNRLRDDSRFHRFHGVDSCLMVPVTTHEYRIGWLIALNRQSHFDDPEFGTVEACVMSSAAALLATHGRNQKLFDEKESLLIGVIRSLINAMDAKDAYTCGHSDRVALIARRLGEEVGLSAQECERLYMTGLLHDIGKIGVPDAVLTKPGRLTKEEFEQIKRHPTIGHGILKHVRQLGYVLPGMLHHHEAMDGTGYPHQLAGDEIPLPARILAVADAFDAMTSNRPYREAMSLERATAILQEGAGRQWDAEIVGSLLRVLPDIERICDHAGDHTQEILGGTAVETCDSSESQHDSIVLAVAANRQ